jgi:hypothetical protein
LAASLAHSSESRDAIRVNFALEPVENAARCFAVASVLAAVRDHRGVRG